MPSLQTIKLSVAVDTSQLDAAIKKAQAFVDSYTWKCAYCGSRPTVDISRCPYCGAQRTDEIVAPCSEIECCNSGPECPHLDWPNPL